MLYIHQTKFNNHFHHHRGLHIYIILLIFWSTHVLSRTFIYKLCSINWKISPIISNMQVDLKLYVHIGATNSSFPKWIIPHIVIKYLLCAVMSWTVSLQNSCWNLNPHYFRRWTFLGIRCWVKMNWLDWALTLLVSL